jgi:site-specific recombinase
MATTISFEHCFTEATDVALLRSIVTELRAASKQDATAANEQLQALTIWLHEHTAQKELLRQAIIRIIDEAELHYIFTESGLLSGSGFFAELSRRFSNKFLPELLPENDLRVAVRTIFNHSKDYQWVSKIEQSTWIHFLKTLDIVVEFSSPKHITQLIASAEILSLRIAALGTEGKIIHQSPNIEWHQNPFTQQYNEWHRYKQQIEQTGVAPASPNAYSRVIQAIDDALRQVRELRRLKSSQGTSLQQTFIVERLSQYLERLQIIVTLIDPTIDVGIQTYLHYFLQVVRNENTQNKIRAFIGNNVSYLAFQIAEHSSHTGEKYITSNSKEYFQFFKSAAIGGLIISFAALAKVGLSSLHLPYFWASFVYGINYALAFVIIHFVHGTIATKQPALTASTIAHVIGNKQTALQNLVPLLAQVARSQFASLTGNLIIVFPLTILLALGVFYLTGSNMIDPTQAASMLQDVSLSGKNIWFASIAGVLLFISGIISGYFDNLVVYRKIPARIIAHPGFEKTFGKKWTAKISGYIDKNLGALMGNIILGFGLGFMIFFGKILGVPFDIRHVTISTGFFGFSLTSLDFQLPLASWLWCIVGLAGIAFTNLAVSFALALYVALRSRRISTFELWPLLKLTARYFLHFPSHFFFPPRRKKIQPMENAATADT